MKRKGQTTDAIEILDRRYDAGRPEREAALQPERVRAAKPRKRLPTGGGSGSAEDFLGPSPLDVLRDLLLLIDEEVPLRWLKQRTLAERIALERWAAKMHARASDHPVRVPPRPKCLPPHRSALAELARERIHRTLLTEASRGLDDVESRRTKSLQALLATLDRRTAALDRGESGDPTAVKREIRARGDAAIAAIRAAASQAGASELPRMRDIDREIAAVRRERTGRPLAARTAGNLAVPPEPLRELLEEAPPTNQQPVIDFRTVGNDFGPRRRKRKARPSGSQPPDKEA